MAWISVHQSILGPKLRLFCNILDCSVWEAEGILVSLWLWGLDNADKYGLIQHADRADIENALSSSSRRSKLRLVDIVDALVESGWIDEDSQGIHLHDWEEWQDQWYKAKERRENDRNKKREIRKRRKSEDEVTVGENSEDVPADSPPENLPTEVPEQSGGNEGENPPDTPPDPPKSDTPLYPPGFQEFWKAYPRKIGKGDAYRKYQSRRKDGFSDTELIEAAKNYALQCARRHTEKEYIKHPKTFLSDTMPFLDFLPKKKEEAAPEQTTPANPFAEYGKDGT